MNETTNMILIFPSEKKKIIRQSFLRFFLIIISNIFREIWSNDKASTVGTQSEIGSNIQVTRAILG